MVTAPYSSKYVLKNFYNLVEDVSEIRTSTRMISLAKFDGGHPKSEKKYCMELRLRQRETWCLYSYTSNFFTVQLCIACSTQYNFW
jgi:hypothetical protein